MIAMKLGDKLLKLLEKKYAPQSTIAFRFGRYDASLVTDEEGNAVLLYMGTRGRDGLIKGYRYTRTLLTAPD
jgi:hypothetical protein